MVNGQWSIVNSNRAAECSLTGSDQTTNDY